MRAQTTILPFAIHQHKTGGVPQLVAEVAVAFAALTVEADVAAQRRQRCKGETQSIRAKGRNAIWEFLFGIFTHSRRGFWLTQTGGTFFQQRHQRDAVDQINRIQHIAFRLAHLFALRIAHQAVNVDVFEGHQSLGIFRCHGEVLGHHDHAGHPEENDVIARHQHAGRQVQIHVLGLLWPAHGTERHECG